MYTAVLQSDFTLILILFVFTLQRYSADIIYVEFCIAFDSISCNKLVYKLQSICIAGNLLYPA